MKLGKKMVEAKTVAINAVYMWFSCGARDRCEDRDCGALLLRRVVGGFESVQAVMRS
jgi:hypothetical protein